MSPETTFGTAVTVEKRNDREGGSTEPDRKRLADVVIVGQIPKNPSGKILRRELRAQVS